MRLVVIAAVIAVCGAAQLDRSYLPPLSAQTAGGSPGAIQTPFSADDSPSQGNQGLGGVPKGAYNNDFQGVVVDAAASGTRATEVGDTGLGAPRPSYGSQNSKVGDAAFESAPTADFRGQLAGANAQNQQGNGVIGQFNGQAAGAQIDQRFGQPSFAAQPAQSTRANAEQDRRAGIIRYENEVGTDTFNYAFETDNGIKAEESGVATNGVQAQGGFSYIGDDGQTYSVTYTADENGYKPVGAHLPTPPPIPKEILQSLEKNAKDEAAGLKDDGSYDAQRYNAGSDYNESDNINGQYNRVQSNKGSGNIATASDATPSGTFIQNSAQPLNQPNFNTMKTDTPVKLNELEEKYRKQSGILIINRLKPTSDVNNAGPSAQVSAMMSSNNGFAQSSNFGQLAQSSAHIESNNAISQSSFGNNAFGQSTFGGNNNFAQQQQTQTPGFGAQKLGYLPPVTGSATSIQNPSIQGSQISDTNRPNSSPSFPSQQFGQASSQQTSQQLFNSQAFDKQQTPTRPTVSQPSPTLSTPFPQPVSNTVQTQNRFQQQSQSFSRQPTPTAAVPSNQQSNGFGCCGKRLPEKPNNISPVAQGFRRQNIPQQVDGILTQTQSSLASTNNFNNNGGTFESQQQLAKQPTGQLQQQVSLQNQFNQNIQTGPELSTTAQKPFNQNSIAAQQQSSSFAQAQDNSYHYDQPIQPFRMIARQPQQGSNNFPTTSSDQFNRVTPQPSFSSQINGLSSSQQNFQVSRPTFGNRQQTTRYPNPPTLASIAPTAPSQQKTEAPKSTFQSQQYNGVTLASASSFSSTPLNQVNAQHQLQQQQFSQRPLRPNFQQQKPNSEFNVQRQEQSQTQFNTQPEEQTQTSFQRPQPTQAFPQQTTTISQSFQRPTSAIPNRFDQNANSFQQKPLSFGQRQSFTQDFQIQTSVEPSTESAPTQQYDGEIYEYNKPAETLPPPDSTSPSVELTLATETTEQNEAQVTLSTERPQFGVRPTANSRPLLGVQQNQFGAKQNQVDAQKTQFGAMQNQFGVQQNQFGAQQNQFGAQQSQFGAQQNQFSAQKNQFGSQQNQFGSQFLGAQESSSPVAGQGEVFGGPRQPPSFNSQTGYHY